jgi:demethylmenaquinone methyltransferase/2-methoxy-6-polyprenyl-1,4-benzoquinol methylase
LHSEKEAKTFFDKFSKEYEAENRYRYQWYRWIVDTIIRQVSRGKPVILDLGTGNGEIAIRAGLKFPHSSVIGIDVSSGMISEAEKKVRRIGLRNVRFIVSPVENLKVERADFVTSNLTFHHIENKLSVITGICKILPRKGRLIIGDWFKPTRAYEKEIEKLRAKNPTLSKKFDESWKDFLSEPSMREYGKRHPKEYPISQVRLENMMKKAGFRKQKIIKMLMATFAVVVGEK